MSTSEAHIKEMNKKKDDDDNNFNQRVRMENESKEREAAVLESLKQNEKQLNNKKDEHTKNTEQEYTVGLNKKDDYAEIDKDYETQFGKTARDRNGARVYAFNNDQEAVDFFKGQAAKGREFQVYKVGEDSCMYSDGKGNFVRGTEAQVEAYKKDPGAFDINSENGALTKKNPEASPNNIYNQTPEKPSFQMSSPSSTQTPKVEDPKEKASNEISMTSPSSTTTKTKLPDSSVPLTDEKQNSSENNQSAEKSAQDELKIIRKTN